MSTNRTGQWLSVVALLLCASCYQSGDSREVGGDSHFLRPCKEQAECLDLADKTCVAGYCRGPGDPTTGDGSSSAPSPSGSGQSNQSSGSPSGSSGEDALPDSTPLVMLVVDTSGSMERMADCTCETPSCDECLPDCAQGDRNRWANVLEALTGTFDDFACERLERSGDPFSYDAGYFLPYTKPSGVQNDDGVLDEFRDRLRFGLATFDGLDTWVGAAPLVSLVDFDFAASASEAGLWSYDPAREAGTNAPDGKAPGAYSYPNHVGINFLDTGIRSERAEQGALRVASDPATARQLNRTIQADLVSVRPYGGTPIASSLDDLYYLFTQDPSMEPERARTAPRHVVLITDGYPDDDYRSFGCNCGSRGDPDDPMRCGPSPLDDPDTMRCPYPTPEEAARALRCGQDLSAGMAIDWPDCGTGPFTQVHVVSFADTDPTVSSRMDAIAIEGGGQGAHHALDELQLRQALEDVFSSIAQ